MNIDSYHLDTTSDHQANQQIRVNESLRAWVGDRRPDVEADRRAQRTPDPAPRISDAARNALSSELDVQQAALHATPDRAATIEQDPRLTLIRHLLKKLTGHDIPVISAADLTVDTTRSDKIAHLSVAAQQTTTATRAGYGIEYDRHTLRTESEQTHFQATGIIRTRDGQEIRVQLDLQMQRSHMEETWFSLRAGDAVRKDPLVINFDGQAAQLHSQRFGFDLEGDGNLESIARLGAHSGYLSLDFNDNGTIDSGQELFGVASGDGFADLARFDDDGNQWIDESDAIYTRLRIWSPDENGNGPLATLKEKQVGALYLGKTETPFELRAPDNQSLGAIRTSGLYLTEDGTAGTLQQIDLTI